MGVALVRLKLGAPVAGPGTLVRLFAIDAPSPTPTTCAGAPAPWTAGNARPLPYLRKTMAQDLSRLWAKLSEVA